MPAIRDGTPIAVVSALKDSKFEDVADKLAEEFETAGITYKEDVKNTPLRIKKTFGVDLYQVMELVVNYDPNPAKKVKNTEVKDGGS